VTVRISFSTIGDWANCLCAVQACKQTDCWSVGLIRRRNIHYQAKFERSSTAVSIP